MVPQIQYRLIICLRPVNKFRMTVSPTRFAYCYLIRGQVQGVGFRPFVYRIAVRLGLAGWVKNKGGEVVIVVQGSNTQLQQFETQLIQQCPVLAHPHIVSRTSISLEDFTDFSILTSESDSQQQIHVPTDYFTCEACLQELHDPQDRRYRYPFINCTQCGPRYTLIFQLPYDRPATSMKDFPLCTHCAEEYHNPIDRRFHAQPLACPQCGPQLHFQSLTDDLTETEATLVACQHALQAGEIIAVKGIGGYHLLCDATQDAPILRLRTLKPRLAKPLAVMFPLDYPLTDQVALTEAEYHLLHSPARPIVLARKSANYHLSALIAPQLQEIGVLLPYSPLHHLLLTDFAKPVVATSANRQGDPVITDNAMAIKQLSHLTTTFLHHNRPIVRPADDSVYRTVAKQPRPIRLGRGSAPLEFTLPHSLTSPVLALGTHLKNTVALAWENRLVVSPHLGDLETPRSLDIYQQLIEDLQRLYAVSAQYLLHDAHPHYANTRWAKQQSLPKQAIYHHHAHASALAGEWPQVNTWLIFTWDGVGLGVDGQLWGGEALYGQPGNWQRLGHLRPFKLLGGEKASREIWRNGLSLCWQTGIKPTFPRPKIDEDLLQQAWQKSLNCPTTTAAGRLFDAAAALTGMLNKVDFEGQAGMWLEAYCQPSSTSLPLPVNLNSQHCWEIDWSPLLPILQDQSYSLTERATLFHNSLAQAIVIQATTIYSHHPFNAIGLSGGVFQNRYLTEQSVQQLSAAGFDVHLAARLPCNDGAISFGQVIEVIH